MLAIAVLVTLIRGLGGPDPWEPLPVFLISLVTAMLLYVPGLCGARLSPRPLGWQIAFAVLGTLFVPFVGFAFLAWVEGNPDAPLNAAWIFALTAACGFAAGQLAGIRIGNLLGGLALIVAWLALWSELLDGLDDHGTLRGLLVVIGLILLLAAVVAAARGYPDGGGADLVTAGGVALVAAGAMSLASIFPGSGLLFAFDGPRASLLWDLELLLAGLALVGYGVVSARRGPVYVGGFGLFAFIITVGLDADDSSPEPAFVGWPLVLLLVAGALIAASVWPLRRRARG